MPCSHSGGKLQQVLTDFRIAALTVPEEIKKKLIKVVTECLDAFAASNTDLGRTLLITHTIKTGDAEPFRHKLRPIPFAKRQFMEQELKRLLSIGAISRAEPGNCQYGSRTVLVPKKNDSNRTCVIIEI